MMNRSLVTNIAALLAIGSGLFLDGVESFSSSSAALTTRGSTQLASSFYPGAVSPPRINSPTEHQEPPQSLDQPSISSSTAAAAPYPTAQPNLAVSPDFSASLRNNEFADVTFLVQDEPIHAHRIILSSRCPAFQGLFDEYTKPFASVKLVIPIRNVEKHVFELLLEYLYTDVVPRNRVELLAPLFAVAGHYNLPQCQEQICTIVSQTLTPDNAALVLEQSFNYAYPSIPQSDALRTCVVDYVRQNFAQVSVTPGMQQYVQSNALLAVVRGRNLS